MSAASPRISTIGASSAIAAGRGTTCCPYFKRGESWQEGANDFHGSGGPLLTSHTSDKPALCERIIQAGIETGLEYREDVNRLPPNSPGGIGWVQQTRRGRRRQSAARTYLRPALRRPNLHLVTDALVHRVLFDGKRAVGVEFSRGGKVERAEALAEVILSGGAIGSPHILQLSGVGDPDHLARIGVPVAHALPGVGKNLQDHFLARVTAEVSGIPTANEKSRGLPFMGELMRYVFAGSGLLTYAASLVAASVKVLEELATPDVQILFANASFAPGPIRRLDTKPGMTGGMWQMRPLSTGYVEAKSSDPHQAPAINPRYLSHETDRRAAIGGLRAVRRIFAAPALTPYYVAEMLPGAEVQSDDELLHYLRQTGSTVFHATCTCKMGRDPAGGGRRPAARPRNRGPARHRCLGDAGRHLDQHQRADDHDRREGRRNDPGYGKAAVGRSIGPDRLGSPRSCSRIRTLRRSSVRCAPRSPIPASRATP